MMEHRERDRPLLAPDAWQAWSAAAIIMCGRPAAWGAAALIWLLAMSWQAVLIQSGQLVLLGLWVALPLVSSASAISASAASGYALPFTAQIRAIANLPFRDLLLVGIMYTGAAVLGMFLIALLVQVAFPSTAPAAASDLATSDPSAWQFLKGAFRMVAVGVLLPLSFPPMAFMVFLVAGRDVPVLLSCRRSRLMVRELSRTPTNAIILMGFPSLIGACTMIMPLEGISNLGPAIFAPLVVYALAFHWVAAVDLSIAYEKRVRDEAI